MNLAVSNPKREIIWRKCWVPISYLWLQMIVFKQGCTLPALLHLESEDETQRCFWGYWTQNGSTLAKFLANPKHRVDSGNNDTLGSEMDISQLEL